MPVRSVAGEYSVNDQRSCTDARRRGTPSNRQTAPAIPLEIERTIVLLCIGLNRGTNASMGKPESKGEQTRRTIVSRALGLVSDVGYEGLSIGALAEESKLSKSGLFAHFKSKEALQLGV